jgi:L-malate glycosyltransferase
MRLMEASRPVSVCFVIDRLNRAGTETQLLALLGRLDRRVVRPSLCLLNGGDSLARFNCPEDCPVVDLRLQQLASTAAISAASRLASFWRHNCVEVVQTYFLDSTYFAAPLARFCGIRHVIRVRNNMGYWLTARHRLLGRLAGRLGITLTNSDDARIALTNAERLSPGRVTVIENGIDLSRFPESPPPDSDRSIVRIGAVANLRPVKNIDGLIRVAVEICRDHPRARFEVAGDGPDRAKLQQQVRDAQLAGRFTFHGAIADIPAIIARLDIAVLCSHSESMSNALLEYMAGGRAIVATDVGSNARLVRHNREGLVVPPRDDSAMSGAIRLLFRQPELARQLGAAARARAQACFSLENTARQFELLYASIARNAGRRPLAIGLPDMAA